MNTSQGDLRIATRAAEPTAAFALSVVIVNWNTADLLERSLRHVLQAEPDAEVVVVDNGSTDGSPNMLARSWPQVHVIANDTNRGYQVAANQGLDACGGQYVLFVNTDAFIGVDTARQLLEHLRRHPEAGAVAPRLVYGDGSFQRWTAGRFPSLASTLFTFSGLDRIFPERGIWLGRDRTKAFRPDWVSSACLAVRRSAVLEVGGLDESYFAYMDDVDLCHRLAAAGWQTWYLPEAEAVHLMGQSTVRETGNASPLAVRGLLRWSAAIHPRQTSAIRLVMAAGFTARALIGAVLSVRRPNQIPAARAHLRHARFTLRTAPTHPASPSAPVPRGSTAGHLSIKFDHHSQNPGGELMSIDLPLSERQQNEARVYDQRAMGLADATQDADLVQDAAHPPYPNREHIAFLDELFARAAPLHGKRVLELGCGSGSLAVYCAQQGAEVCGLDVSEPMLALARRRAAINGVSERTSFVHCPAERWTQSDGSFDVVLANQVLHHLELDDAMANVARLLSPDGVALFVEPVLLLPSFARRVRAHPLVLRRFPSRADTPDERSLNRDDLVRLAKPFKTARIEPQQLTTRVQNFFDLSDCTFTRLERVDRMLHRYVPGSRALARYVLIDLRGQAADNGGNQP